MSEHTEDITMADFVEFLKYNHEGRDFIDFDLPIQVLLSGAGYYIGQLDDCMPYTRLSVEYWGTQEEAQAALDNFQFTARTYL